ALIAPAMVELFAFAPPWERQPLREVLARVAKEAKPNDAFYVTYGAAQAWQYYAPRFNFTSHPMRVGACRDDAPQGYLREVEALRGVGRVWIIYVPAGNLRDPSELLDTAEDVGNIVTRIEASDHFYRDTNRVGAYLYDFASGSAQKKTWQRSAGSVEAFATEPPAPSCRGAAVIRENEAG
ncbi:MAG: hypothetical protein ABIT38_21470, partial [Gemmatimonadaceae bacterium]